VKFGADTYRQGGSAQLEASRVLLKESRLCSSIYLGGLAVECMLRALTSLEDRAFDERHDLRRMAVRVEELGLVRRRKDEDFVVAVQEVTRVWSNDLRFAGDDQVMRQLRRIGVLNENSQKQYRSVAKRHHGNCRAVFERCEVLWQRQKSPKRN